MRRRFARILPAGPVNLQYLVPGKLFSANTSATPPGKENGVVVPKGRTVPAASRSTPVTKIGLMPLLVMKHATVSPSLEFVIALVVRVPANTGTAATTQPKDSMDLFVISC